ncbi:apolipoprotein N-acyltransferase [candidate division KSB1 bacterium]|nr:apolipoprotein N-acyltransferase [candidate division KSB1 bacterium]
MDLSINTAKHKALLLSLLTGFLLALAFPPFKTGFLAYLGLIPLFFLLEGKSPAESFGFCYLSGLVFNGCTLFWIAFNRGATPILAIISMVIGVLYLSLYFGIFGLLFQLVQRYLKWGSYVMAPFLWGTLEYQKSIGELGFPWQDLGNTQTFYLNFIQFAEFTGVFGISFWVVLINVLLFWVFKGLLKGKVPWISLTSLALAFAFPYGYGKAVIPSQNPNDPGIRVALIQGNIDPEDKWSLPVRYSLEIYRQDTEKILSQKPDLIIWPETAVPHYIRYKKKYYEYLRALVDSMEVPLFTGTPDYRFLSGGERRVYNSAFLFKPRNPNIEEYSKIQLVPFGERVPFQRYFPFLGRLNFGQAEFAPGEDWRVFQLSGSQAFSFSASICFEFIFPDLVRRFVKEGADLLVNITNDAWFGRTPEAEQHARFAVLRAVENRRPVARCANTGVSLFIDPYGRVQFQTALFERTTIVNEIPLVSAKTFYTSHGNLFARLMMVISVLFVLVSFILKVRNADRNQFLS